MKKLEQFCETVRTEMTATLSTASGESVTMRLVSPVLYQNSVLIFTHRDSLKYRQLVNNPNCCISVGAFFCEATAEFFGKTMLDGNKRLRDAYSEKFPGAFESGVEFGGTDAEFILLKPSRLSGWAYPDGSTGGEGIPSVPFEIIL